MRHYEKSPILLASQAKNELSRRYFWEFCLNYDLDFFSNRLFLKDIANSFQQIYDKEIKSLSISMPPRAGKSYITSLYCAWLLGKQPHGSVMRNCCTATLYDKFSYDVRDILRSELYKRIFPDTQLSSDKQNLKGWNTTKSIQVSYFGAGVGGTIIGFGATIAAITDDLFKSFEDATSEQINEKTHNWYSGSHKSRIEKGCPVIDIGTRWSKNDVIGKNLEENRYDKVIIIPALNKHNKSFCESVLTTDEYLKRKNETPSEIWDAEYMQEPSEIKGTLFPKNELQFFIPNKEYKYESSIGYIDVADQGIDYLSAVCGKNIGKEIFITDIIFTNENTDITLPQCAEWIKINEIKYCRVEANAMGAMFARQLQQLTPDCQILQAVSTNNKHTRILMESVAIKNYCKFLEEIYQNSEYKAFIKQLTNYTKIGSKHDDAPDSLTGLINFIRTMLSHYY